MRWRSRILILALAALGGFLVSRPDIRKYLSQNWEEYKLSLYEAMEIGKDAAAKKEQELLQEVKSTQD